MLTPKQAAKYWRTWRAVCIEQGWHGDTNDRRYALHATARCPQSMRDFTNADFNRFLHAAAPLAAIVDVRDRERECVLHAIQVLGQAIHSFRDLDKDAYVRVITRDMSGTTDLDDIPTKDARSRDLINLRNVLNNRLSATISAAKRGQIEWPRGKEHWVEHSNTDIISALIGGHDIAPPVPHRRVWHMPNRQFQPRPQPQHPF